MRFIYFLSIALFCSFAAIAQEQPVRNSLRMGIDVVPIDGLYSPALRYQLRYGKHLFMDRLVIGASLGYLWGNGKEKVREGLYIDGNLRRRVTGDISVLYDLIPSSKYALRIGGGPSVVYRQDNTIRSMGFNFNQDGSLISKRVERSDVTGFLVGYHLILEYEQPITANLALSGRIGLTDAKHDTPIIQAGFGVSYSFR